MDTALHSKNNPGEGGNALPYICAEWPKGRETVRVSVTEYKGKPLLDLRQWYTAADGELRPSPKGLTITLDALPKLVQALDAAQAFVNAHGLLREGGDA